jgi:hypothetical protein
MTTMTITSPKTSKSVNVRVWDIDTKAAVSMLKSEGVKALSWSLLSQKHSVRAMEQTEGGDCAESSFSLSVFEHGLDWKIGLAVNGFIRDALAIRRCPKSFRLGVSRKGDTFIIVSRKSGDLWVSADY